MIKELDALKRLKENSYYINDKNMQEDVNILKQALLNKSKKEDGFEEIQSIIDTWHTSHIMDNESALREIDKIICEVLNK